jgi:hypothetical protein
MAARQPRWFVGPGRTGTEGMCGGEFRKAARQVRQLIKERDVLSSDLPTRQAGASGVVARPGLQILQTSKPMRPNLTLMLLSVSLCAARGWAPIAPGTPAWLAGRNGDYI